MKKVRLFVAVVLVVAFLAGTAELMAKPPAPGPSPCPVCTKWRCPEIYMPVVCANGCTYSNACFATCAGARNCVPAGDTI